MLTMFGGSPKREISCRARRMAGLLNPEPHGPWVYRYLVLERTRPDDVDTMTKIYTKEDPCNGCVVEPWTVGQYAGKRDKNEAMIYEGDIVKVYGAEETVHEVQWDDDWSGFCLYSKEFGCTAIPLDTSKIEIIGNIHDNPELLE